MTELAIFGIFMAGAVLIAVEAFVIPGFGAPGILGAVIVGYAAFRAWTDIGALWGIVLGAAAMFGTLFLVVWVPKSRMGQRLTLKESINATTTYDDEAKRAGVTEGSVGTTSTELKPSGFAIFGEDRVEVRSDGEFIDRDAHVVVTHLRDGKVFVEPYEEPADAAES